MNLLYTFLYQVLYNFIEVFTDDPPATCSTVNKNSINHRSTSSRTYSPSLHNILSTSETYKQSFPYATENLKCIEKLGLQFSDLRDTEYVTLCNLLVKNKHCYTTNKMMLAKLCLLFLVFKFKTEKKNSEIFFEKL